jgi:hypothetical protein
MFLLRGIQFTYEAVRDWGAKLTPPLIDDLRRRRGGGSRVRRSWYVDETYIKVNGRWCYLYRAIDRTGVIDETPESGKTVAYDCRITCEIAVIGLWRIFGERLAPLAAASA